MELPDDQPIKRWTAKRRSALVMTILRGETSVPEAARRHGLAVAEVEEWRDRFSAPSAFSYRMRYLASHPHARTRQIHRCQAATAGVAGARRLVA